MGKCERIKNTVFPRSYSLILHILIYAFTAILPFSLNHNQFVTEIAISIIIPLLFIAVEKTAIIMQDPFENSPVDTPMTSIAQTIEINILQMMILKFQSHFRKLWNTFQIWKKKLFALLDYL